MVYRPGLVVEVDWDDDGTYGNALSDVSADHHAHVLSIGAEVFDEDVSRVPFAPADGELRLRDFTDVYDVSAPSGTLTSTILRAPPPVPHPA